MGGVDALFPIEAHAFAVKTLLLQSLRAFLAAKGGAHQVDGGRHVEGPRVGGDGAAGVEEFLEGRRAREGEIEGKVLGGEDEAYEGVVDATTLGASDAADVGEVEDGLGGFDESDELERFLLLCWWWCSCCC